MEYPVMITSDDLVNVGVYMQTGAEGDPEQAKSAEAENRFFLSLIHRTLYEMVLFTSHRNLRKRLIEANIEALREPLKAILVDIGKSAYLDGDFVAVWSGKTRGTDGRYDFTDLQARMLASIPPMTWQAVFSLEPNVMFSGLPRSEV